MEKAIILDYKHLPRSILCRKYNITQFYLAQIIADHYAVTDETQSIPSAASLHEPPKITAEAQTGSK